MKPGALGRFAWAARNRRQPTSLAGLLRLWWHDFVIHPLFEGGERCQDCGHDYPLWHAEGNLWERIRGTTGGLLCPTCFDRQAHEAGVVVEYRAIPFDSAVAAALSSSPPVSRTSPENEKEPRPIQ